MPRSESQKAYNRKWEREKGHNKRNLYNNKKKDLIATAKDKPCTVCGKMFPGIAMDLHHINPDTKSFSITSGYKSNGYEALKDELNKCIPLCAICHRLLHAGLVELVT